MSERSLRNVPVLLIKKKRLENANKNAWGAFIGFARDFGLIFVPYPLLEKAEHDCKIGDWLTCDILYALFNEDVTKCKFEAKVIHEKSASDLSSCGFGDGIIKSKTLALVTNCLRTKAFLWSETLGRILVPNAQVCAKKNIWPLKTKSVVACAVHYETLEAKADYYWVADKVLPETSEMSMADFLSVKLLEARLVSWKAYGYLKTGENDEKIFFSFNDYHRELKAGDKSIHKETSFDALVVPAMYGNTTERRAVFVQPRATAAPTSSEKANASLVMEQCASHSVDTSSVKNSNISTAQAHAQNNVDLDSISSLVEGFAQNSQPPKERHLPKSTELPMTTKFSSQEHGKDHTRGQSERMEQIHQETQTVNGSSLEKEVLMEIFCDTEIVEKIALYRPDLMQEAVRILTCS